MAKSRILIADDEKNTCRYIKQHIKMEPDINADIDFAHHLDQLVQSNARFDPIITARIEVSLNGRDFRELVDPELDLSKVPAYEPSYLWIKPFGKR